MHFRPPTLYFGVHWSEQFRVAPAVELTDEQEVELTTLVRSKRTSVRLAQRAQIVQLERCPPCGEPPVKGEVAKSVQLTSQGKPEAATHWRPCCDDKRQVQALDRTQPGLPTKNGRAQTMTHDYKRNGTTALFALRAPSLRTARCSAPTAASRAPGRARRSGRCLRSR